MGEWADASLGDVVEHKKGFAFKSADYLDSGHPIVRVSNFTDRSIALDDCNYLHPNKIEQYEGFTLRHRDVVVATVGSWPTNPASVVGKTVSVPPDVDGALLNQNAVRLRANHNLDQRFLFYLMKQPRFQAHILGAAQGSASQASIKLTDIFSFRFPRPPLTEQKAIAATLGSLDDKIDLNRRMNETLEAIARALFKDWFVDFGPTRAKAEGRPPYLAPEIWDLFPDALDDEDKPVGWETYALHDLAHHHRATVSPSAEPEGTFEHYSIPAYDAGNEPTLDSGGSIKSNKTIVPEGALLLSKLNPEIERVWLPNPVGDLPRVASTEFLAFTPLAHDLVLLEHHGDGFGLVDAGMLLVVS